MAWNGFTFSITENHSFLLIILWKQCENVETYFQAYNRLVDFSTSKSIYGQSTWQYTSMQFKIYFLYHTCYNVFQFPRENCNDRYIHHLAKNVKVFFSLHPLLLSTNIELMFAVYLFNLESIYSQSTSQISEEKKVEITYLSTVWNVTCCKHRSINFQLHMLHFI